MTKITYQGTQQEKKKAEANKDLYNNQQFFELINSTPSKIDQWIEENVIADDSVKLIFKYLFRHIQSLEE